MTSALQQKEAEQVVTTAPVAGAGVVMAVLFLVFFLGISDNQMVSPLLPLIAKEFRIGPGDAGKLIGPAYALAAAMVALVVGPASDRLGRRRFLLVASIVFAVSLVAVLFIKGIDALAGVRFFTGLAAGTFSTCSIAYVGDFFPYERRGVAMSVVNSGYFAALVVGVPTGSLLAQHLGWRSGFVAFGAIALVTFFLVLFVLPEDKHKMAASRAAVGTVRRADNLRIVFESKESIAAIVAAFFVSAGFVGFIFYLGSWLAKAFGLTTSQIGRLFIVIGVSALLGALAAGPIADRFGKRGLALGATIVLAATLALTPRLGFGIGLLTAFLVASLAFAFRQGPVQALATELVPRRARGTLVAVRTTMSQGGIALSTGLCGVLYDRYGYGAVGLFCSIATVAAAISIYMMREPKHRPEGEW
ncbi:MAG TPA: MFS transporter [Blastocatellia bacterium]|nr:MFS transporter [Blastocatellia bacterium]